MLIIVEGADKTGKTTLCKVIAKRFGYRYHHFGPPKKRPADEYIDFLLSLKQPTVCDRFHLGELVYGPMLRGKVGITPLELLTIERMLRLKRAILIHAATDMDVANERLAVSKQRELVDWTMNINASRLFEKVIAQTNVSTVFRYNGIAHEQLDLMLNVIERWLRLSDKPRGTKYTGIGTTGGRKLVFVGEQVNKNITWRHLPFDKGLSSEFLAEAFEAAGILERFVYICNADKLTEAEAAALAGPTTRFISLGKKADKKLNEFGVQHAALPHPQWVKRFHYADKRFYAEDIRQACL